MCGHTSPIEMKTLKINRPCPKDAAETSCPPSQGRFYRSTFEHYNIYIYIMQELYLLIYGSFTFGMIAK